MALKKQLSVMVVNEIGEGAKLCGILKEAGINIEAISVWEYTEGSVVRMVVNDDKKAARVLREKGYGVLVRVVLSLVLDDAPGALGEVMGRLAKNSCNINYCYGTVAQGVGKAVLILAVDDPVRADLLFSGKN
jgi:hypothetical protein